MKLEFKGSIPSKKNGMMANKRTGQLFPTKPYLDFKKSLQMQVMQNYPQLEHLIKASSTRPLCFVLDITRYENRDFDWTNRISTVEDALFNFHKKKGVFECLPLDDSYKSLKIYPGVVSIDKDNLDSKKDDYFVLTLVQEITRFNEIDL